MKEVVLLITILLTGLSAGLFYAWAVSVIPGTKRLADNCYLETMQNINQAILNPWFFIIFFGPILLLFWSTYLHFRVSADQTFWLILGAAVVYLAGTFGITVFGNVPLNESLDAVSLQNLAVDEMQKVRNTYEGPWNRFHLVRTIFSVIAFVLLLVAAK